MEAIDSNPLAFAVALALGLLVGMQRERAENKPIGIRSFALISVIGALCGSFTTEYGTWVLAAGLLTVSAAIILHSYLLARDRTPSGMTTELAAIAMCLIGALTTTGAMTIAIILAGVLTLLLQWKRPMHAWVRHIDNSEYQAVARFVLLSLVVLPALPNESFGPYAVLNPFKIWLMVVLIVGMNLAGYFAMKLSTGRGGAVLGGVFGGLISSTATTVSFASRSRSNQTITPAACVVILLACALVYVRIVIETAAVAHALLPSLIGPVAVFSILFLITLGIFLFHFEHQEREDISTNNPAQFKTAFGFGALYSVVLFASAAAIENFGESMLYPLAIISGLTDVDAMTLSTARMFDEARISSDTAWRVIFIASLSNLVFKAGAVAVLGGSSIRRRLLPALVGLSLAGVFIVIYWP